MDVVDGLDVYCYYVLGNWIWVVRPSSRFLVVSPSSRAPDAVRTSERPPRGIASFSFALSSLSHDHDFGPAAYMAIDRPIRPTELQTQYPQSHVEALRNYVCHHSHD